jgi:3-oxoacyl-[acyl-carrier protein] reductase
VTGVSRRAGIGFAVARRLRGLGAGLFVQGFAPHDAAQPWGADRDGVPALAAELEAAGLLECDFADPAAPAACMAAAVVALGHVDVLVANHAMSCDQDLEALDAAAIDATLAVNVRATLLLVQAYAAQHDDARPGGRVLLFTSGQHLEPMTRELPYAASKGALHGVAMSLAAHLAPRGILVNALNPGPTDTGWATPEQTRAALRRLPLGRWGSAADAARIAGWLATDDAGWVTGQVLTSDGGFSLSRD